MKKVTTIIIMAVLCVLCFTGCGNYVSKYDAVAFVHSDTSQRGEMSFSEFKGTYVYKLTRPSENAKLVVGGSVQSGKMTVYVDHDGAKREFMTIDESGKMQVNYKTGFKNKTIYVIVQADTKCEEGVLLVKFSQANGK